MLPKFFNKLKEKTLLEIQKLCLHWIIFIFSYVNKLSFLLVQIISFLKLLLSAALFS